MGDQNRKRGIFQESSPQSSPSKKPKELCRYGVKCYRKNPDHFAEFDHPHLAPPAEGVQNTSPKSPAIKQNNTLPPSSSNASLSSSNNHSNDSAKKHTPQTSAKSKEAKWTGGSVASRVAATAPFRMMLTRVDHIGNEDGALAFADLLDPSLGTLTASLQINFLVDTDWLNEQYFLHNVHNCPLTLLYDSFHSDDRSPLRSNVTALKVKPASAFGHHHTKMSVMSYKDGSIRVVVSTANLIESDWQDRTQALWMSDRLPPGSREGEGDSPTGFKADLLLYLRSYPDTGGVVRPWIQRLCQADCSGVNVVFVASVPGSHRGAAASRWGHFRLRRALADAPEVHRGWPLVAQCSSLGTLGPSASAWLEGEMSSSCAGGRPAPPVHLVYPSHRNVMESHDGLMGGACLPYVQPTHAKQRWLTAHMRQWVFNSRRRSAAPPHVKSYTRLRPDAGVCAWLLLTSANLSKAAWGRKMADGSSLNLMSYEAGVLWLPQFVLGDGSKEFPTSGPGAAPLPFDVPLTPYRQDDEPWTFDALQAGFQRAMNARGK